MLDLLLLKSFNQDVIMFF